jgi:ankyrin repeat protein
MMASIFGRTDNVKFWLNRFPDWDLERKNKVVGGVALGQAVYMGPHRLKLVKILLDHGASMSLKNYSGASILVALCSSEDCDPEIVKLANAYIWYDWFSQPQPSRGTSQDEIARLKRDLTLASDSVPAYVERADTLMILAPSSVHADMVDEQTGRKTYTCYRTWRRRGFCVLEFFCANLSRRSTHPVLLVRSDLDTPIWISPQESLKLAVGECNFTCCETNHLGHGGGSKMKCSRKNVKIVLRKMIDAKANHLFTMKNVVYGRWTRVLKHWWSRTIDGESWISPFARQKSLKDDLQTWLDWDENIDGTFFDRDGVSLLIYAVSANHFEAVSYLLTEINNSFKSDAKERQRHIESRIPKSGFLNVGIPGSCTALIGAMTLASTEIVQLLLNNGANPLVVDVSGNNTLMCACTFNRLDNVKLWLKEFPDWDLEAGNTINGSIALGTTVYMGPNRLKLAEFLIQKGARCSTLTHSGASVLIAACASQDADPSVVKLILQHCNSVNYQQKSRTSKWYLIHSIAKTVLRTGLSENLLLKFLALERGETALHKATRRGDVEIVEILLHSGINPSLRNDLGLDAAARCKSFPELRGVLEKRERKMKLRGTAKKTKAVEVLGKRISTSTPIQHAMWLISLETLLMLYVCSFIFLSHSLIYHTPTLTSTQVRRR